MAVKINNANLSGGAGLPPSASAKAKKAAPVAVPEPTPAKPKAPKQESLAVEAQAATAKEPTAKQLAAVNKGAEAVAVSGALGSNVMLSQEQKEDLEVMVDEYCRLSDEIAAIHANPIFQRFEEVSSSLKAFVAEHVPQSVEFTAHGTDCYVEFSACSKSARKIVDLAAVRDAVGDEVFLGMVSISVTTAQKYLTGDQIDKVCAPQTYTNTRKMTAKFMPKA